MLLGIDELEHADDLALLVLHRDDHHRFGAVAEFLVEIAIELEGEVADPVGVFDIQYLPGRSRVAGDAAGVDGNGELAEGNGVAVVLSQLEDEIPFPAALFHEIERTGVGGGDLAALAQNQFQQRVGVLLRRERNPDLIQGLKVRRRPAQFEARLALLLACAQVRKRLFHRRGECDFGNVVRQQREYPRLEPAGGRGCPFIRQTIRSLSGLGAEISIRSRSSLVASAMTTAGSCHVPALILAACQGKKAIPPPSPFSLARTAQGS